MKILKVEGKNKKTVKLCERFLDKINFEKHYFLIFFETIAKDIEWYKTDAFQKFKKIVEKEKKESENGRITGNKRDNFR